MLSRFRVLDPRKWFGFLWQTKAELDEVDSSLRVCMKQWLDHTWKVVGCCANAHVAECGRRTQTTQICKHINRAKNKVTSQHQKVIDISLIEGSHFGVHRPFTYMILLFRDLPSCLMILWCFLRKRSHIGSSKCLHSMWDNHDGSVFRSFNYRSFLLYVGKLYKGGFLRIICCDNWNTYLCMVKISNRGPKGQDGKTQS